MDNKQLAVDYYRKGIAAMEQENWRLAVEMFGSCIRFSPGVEGYRRLLAKCQQQLENSAASQS